MIFNRKSQWVPIINPNFHLESMGIGGLDAEFQTIFRHALISRVFPPEVIYQLGKLSQLFQTKTNQFFNYLGIKHCRGILLYGPSGTGKSLMAQYER